MAESITYDFISRGADKLAGDFKKTGDSAAAAARGAAVLQKVIGDLGQKEDRTAAQSRLLADALRRTGDAEDRAAAKAVLADAAIRRLDDAMQDSSKHSSELGKALSGLKLNPGLIGPALALAPALATLSGVAAGAAVGLAGAFTAGAGALAAFGVVAKPVLTDAKTAAAAVETAQNNYNAAIAGGTKKAVAYKAEQIAIAKAYAELSPAQIALSKQLGNMANAWQNVKAAQTPVVAGALQPWLKSVTDLTGKLGPVIGAVSPFIQYLGTQVDRLVNSAAFTHFRDFIAGTGSAAVGAIGNAAIDLVKAFIVILPQFAPLINKASAGVLSFGQNVLKWAQSKQASADITKFMAWFTANGPVVGRLLVNIGLALKALTPGLTSGGALELKLISGFFAFVAKLPPAVAKPISEVAGALLILNKLGVINVGVKIVGAAAKWLAGGLVELGGGAAAGTEIRTAMVSGGAAAGAEIRTAMAEGGAATGAAVGGGEAAAMKLSAPAIGTVLGLAVAAQLAGYFGYKKFSDLFTAGVKGATAPGRQGAPIGAVLAGTGTNTAAKITHPAGLDALLKELGFVSSSISLINKAVLKPGSDVGKIDALIYSLGGTQADILAVNKLITKPKSDSSNILGLRKNVKLTQQDIAAIASFDAKPKSDSTNIDALLKRIGLTGPQIASVNRLKLIPGEDPVFVDAMLRRIGLTPGQIANVNRLVLRPHADTTPVTQLQKAIDSLHGRTVNVILHAAGSGSIYFNESTGVGGDVKGGLKFMAAGGRVPGTGSGDTVPAMLTPGEAVVPRHLVPAVAPVLRGKVPGFAAGGVVPDPRGLSGWMAGVEAPFARSVENSFAVRLIANLKAAVKKAAAAVVPGGVYLGPGSGNYAADIATVLKQFGMPLWLVPNWLRQIQTESGGNLNAVNRTDSNARAGHPSVGLLQLIPSTFAAFSGPYRNAAPLVNYGGGPVSENAMAQIYTAIKYADIRYGGAAGMAAVIGHGHGYDRGGWLMPGATLAINNTGRPEQVIPPGGTAAGGVHLHLTVNAPVGSQQQLEDWFVQTANKAARTGRLAQAVKTAAR